MRTLSTLALLLFTTGSAHATTITVTYSGFLNAAFGSGTPGAGETFAGVYSYDDAEPDNDPANPLHGSYIQAVLTHSISFSGGTVRVADIFESVDLTSDFPGYGESDPVESDPITGCVETVIKVLDALKIDKAHIIGNA